MLRYQIWRVDLDARLLRLEDSLVSLAEAQTRTEAAVSRLAEAQALTEAQLVRQVTRLQTLMSWQRGEASRREGKRYERDA